MLKLVNQDGDKEYDPCEYYEWRLNWLEDTIAKRHARKDKIPIDQYQRWFDEEEKVYQNHLRDYEKIKKLNKPIGIIVPTHKYHNTWLRSSLEQCSKTGYWTLLAFDNPFYNKSHDITQLMPSVETLMYADEILMKPKTWGGGVGIPHSWSMYMGMKMMKGLGFPYTLNVNGDIILEKPEGVDILFNMMQEENADIIACEYEPGRYLGTMVWLAKTDVALKMWEMNMEKLYQINYGNAEARMGKFASILKLKVLPVKNPSDHHFKDWTYDSTFRKVLGLRHLHAEHKDRRKRRDEPPEEKYYDKRYLNNHEMQTLVKYWKTKDRKFLEKWWG